MRPRILNMHESIYRLHSQKPPPSTTAIKTLVHWTHRPNSVGSDRPTTPRESSLNLRINSFQTPTPPSLYDPSFFPTGPSVQISISFEFILCVLRTGCDVVVNRCAVCLLLLRGNDESLFFFFNAFSFLRQRVSMCLLDGRRIPVWK